LAFLTAEFTNFHKNNDFDNRDKKLNLFIGRGAIKKNGRGDKFKYDIFDVLSFVNSTIYPTQHNNK
jgi:hypothetical protein